jgi:hypothetical protein
MTKSTDSGAGGATPVARRKPGGTLIPLGVPSWNFTTDRDLLESRNDPRPMPVSRGAYRSRLRDEDLEPSSVLEGCRHRSR